MDPIILEALQRREPGGSLYVGNANPAAGQVNAPTGTTPAGGPNTPTTPPPQAPGSPPPNAQIGKAVRAAGAVNGPNFEDDTRRISKALISNLIKYL